MFYFLLICIRWGALLVSVLLVLAIIGSEKKSEYGVYTVICLLSFMLFIFIPKMPIYATENYKDVEYSKDGKKPYNTHIKI